MNSDHSAQPFSFTFNGKTYPVSPIKGAVEAEYERRAFQNAKDSLRDSQDILCVADYAAEGKRLYDAFRRGEFSLEYAMSDKDQTKTVGLTLMACCFGMTSSEFQVLWTQAYGPLMDLFFELVQHAFPAAAPVIEAKKKQLPKWKAAVASRLDSLISTACAEGNAPPESISSKSTG